MSEKHVRIAAKKSAAKGAVYHVLCAIALDIGHRDEPMFSSVRELASRSRCAINTVRKSIDWLVENGEIELAETVGQRRYYRFLLTSDTVSDTVDRSDRIKNDTVAHSGSDTVENDTVSNLTQDSIKNDTVTREEFDQLMTAVSNLTHAVSQLYHNRIKNDTDRITSSLTRVEDISIRKNKKEEEEEEATPNFSSPNFANRHPNLAARKNGTAQSPRSAGIDDLFPRNSAPEPAQSTQQVEIPQEQVPLEVELVRKWTDYMCFTPPQSEMEPNYLAPARQLLARAENDIDAVLDALKAEEAAMRIEGMTPRRIGAISTRAAARIETKPAIDPSTDPRNPFRPRREKQYANHQ